MKNSIHNIDDRVFNSKLEQAQKHVKKLKAWYWSIPVYILGTIMMLFLTLWINPPFWMKIVLLSGPVLWWVFFMVQGIYLFFPKANFIKNWEEKKIKQFVDEANEIG